MYDSSKAEMICAKIEDFIESAGVPMQAFLATTDDKYRKPATAMWQLFNDRFNDGVVADEAQSVYCGDAAGRIAGWRPGVKKDFSWCVLLTVVRVDLSQLQF